MLITMDEYLPIARRFEGVVDWLYLDTAGLVTIGIGHMIPNAAAMAEVPMVQPDGTAATDADKQAAYAAVFAEKAKIGQAHTAFRDTSPLRLAKGGDEVLFRSNFETLFGEAQRLFKDVAGGFPAWPKPVQLATFDMAYNLGPARLYKLFPSFREKGLAVPDYAVCAEQCERGGIGEARNAWTRKQFEIAAASATS